MTATLYSPHCEAEADFIYARHPEPAHILVVDDEPILRRLNAQALFRWGYRVDTAVDGQAGWEAIQANYYDLLLTDHKMPRMTGWDLIKQIRIHEVELPVVLTTAECPEELLEQQGNLHINAVLLKPYTLQELQATVNRVLHSEQQSRTKFAPSRRWRT